MADLSGQQPVLVWHPDYDEVRQAWLELRQSGVLCSSVVTGTHYSVFCAYLDVRLAPELAGRLRQLASYVQVSMSPGEKG